MMPEHAWTRAKRRWLGRVPDRTIALRVGISAVNALGEP